MATWQTFSEQAPELAAFGKARFASGVAYLATVRADGSPRVHPVTPIVGEQLFLFMEPNSPKGKDLVRDPRFSLHCSVEDWEGGQGEFYVRGRAKLVTEAETRALATAAASYQPRERYILFALGIDFAFMNVYGAAGEATVERWAG